MFALNRGWKAREARCKIFVPCRMKAGDAWSDATLLNISSRGLLAQAQSAPPRGAYVEIRKQACVIVGRVVWAKDDTFGIRTQDRIDMADLLSAASTRPPEGGAGSRGMDRRMSPDRNAAVTPPDRLDRSRRIAAAFQFTILAGVGAVTAITLAATVKDRLSAPLQMIEAHL